MTSKLLRAITPPKPYGTSTKAYKRCTKVCPWYNDQIYVCYLYDMSLELMDYKNNNICECIVRGDA